MKCEICGKNDATVHLTVLTQSTGEKSRKIDLCETCAKAHGVDDPTGFSLITLLEALRREIP